MALSDNLTNNTSFASDHNLTDGHGLNNGSYQGGGTPAFGRRYPLPQVTTEDIVQSVFLIGLVVVSTLGNSAVLWISSQRVKKNKSVRLHILVLSLAASDILQGLIHVTPQLAETLNAKWVSGLLVCKIHAAARSMLANISICTLALIAIERFVYLDKIDRSSNIRLYVVAVSLIWCVQCAMAIPLAVWSEVDDIRRACSIPLDLLDESEEYTIITRVLCFFFPLLMLWICNVGIIYKLRMSTVRIQPMAAVNIVDQNRKKRDRHATLTCLALASFFTITFGPFQAALLVIQLGTPAQVMDVLKILRYFWIMTVINSCINPFIYGIFLKEFRQKLMQMFAKSKCCRGASTATGTLQTTKNPSSITSPQTEIPAQVISPGTLETRLRTQNTSPAGASTVSSNINWLLPRANQCLEFPGSKRQQTNMNLGSASMPQS